MDTNMSPEQAKDLLQKLDKLNNNLDLLSQSLQQTFQSIPPDENQQTKMKREKTEKALRRLEELLGKDFVKRSIR